MDSSKPLTVGEIEELKRISADYDKHGVEWKEAMFVLEALPRLLSLLTPPPDAAVREAVNENRLHEAEQRVQHNCFSLCARADLEQELRIALASLRAVQAPRLTAEQVEAVKEAKEVFAIRGDVKLANRLDAAFPELFAGEVDSEGL